MADKSFKILVVDDEPDLETLVLQRMRREIRRGSYEFEFARNGLEAIARVEENPDIDLVLTDINMPQMDGLQLLERLSNIEQNHRSVVVSAYGDMQNIRTAMNRGAFDFIIKPVDFNDLRVTIARTVANLEEWREALADQTRLYSIQSELEVAQNMQLSILPTEFPMNENFHVHAHMEAAREVGGDFYDVYELDDDRWGIAIADVSGKGVPAALFMMVSRTLLKSSSSSSFDPAETMRIVNNLLCMDNESLMFVTTLYAVYDQAKGTITYANGGHNPMLIVHSDGSSEFIDPSDGIALGVMPEFEFTSHTIELSPGDALVFYTDGVTEAEDGKGNLFDTAPLQELFKNRHMTNPQEINEAIFEAVHAFAGDYHQTDDITCLTLVA